MTASVGKRRIGRPPSSENQDTEQRILDAAREQFANLGYAAASMKSLAAAADVTPGAIYHHYASKQDLFVAVYCDVTERVFSEFEAVVADGASLADTICRILDVASQLHERDRTLARFSAISAMEVQRHPELAEAIAVLDDAANTPRFFADIVRRARKSGQLPEDLDAASVGHMLVAVTLGLAQFGALVDSFPVHRKAVAALEYFIRAGLREPGSGSVDA